VDRKRNRPTHNPNSADGEVMLDIEVAGAMAPGARIVVYFAPNTDRGFLDAITTAVHDQHYQPSVISISWGAPEAGWTAQAMQAFDQAFQDAAALGVTVCCASGDNGSDDGVSDGKAHVDFPAASPYALACGGTRLETAGARISREVVWNNGASGGSTGGGVSDTFALPTWQKNAGVPPSANAGGHVGRGVPDVAGDADPATGYRILVDGQEAVFGGTSAVAPLWSALIARLNQQLSKPVGYLNPLLYRPLPGACHDITSGSNGAYQARAGWDACTGWGSPDGTKLLTALSTAH
jgi:kumamolisin